MTAGVFVRHFVSFHRRPSQWNTLFTEHSPNLLVALPSRNSCYYFHGMKGQQLINSDTIRVVSVFLLRGKPQQLLTAPANDINDTQREVSLLGRRHNSFRFCRFDSNGFQKVLIIHTFTRHTLNYKRILGALITFFFNGSN